MSKTRIASGDPVSSRSLPGKDRPAAGPSGTRRGSVSRQGRQRRGGGRRRSRPKGACVVIFHVRELAPVEDLVDGFHASWKRSTATKRGRKPDSGKPSGKGGHAHGADHPPLFMTDEKHLIALAPTRPDGDSIRRALERALGDAVEHVKTRFYRAPRGTAPGGAAPRHRQ